MNSPRFIMLLVVSATLLTFTRCSKSDPTPAAPAKAADVYVAGTFNTLAGTGYNFIPVYWKNGEMHKLSVADAPGDVYAIAVIGDEIQVIGNLDANGDELSIWKNGEISHFANAGSYVYSVKVIGTDVYALGMINDKATYWVNGSPTTLSTTSDSRIYDVVKDGTDLYVAGFERNVDGYSVATVWKNGSVFSSLSDGKYYAEANGIAINNGTVYVTGTDNQTLKLWTDGNETILGTAGKSGTGNNSVAVLKGDVYVAGYDNDEAKIWKNNIATTLPKPADLTKHWGYSIATQGNDVFVRGEGTKDGNTYPVLVWKNGVLTDKYDGTTAGTAYGFTVVAGK